MSNPRTDPKAREAIAELTLRMRLTQQQVAGILTTLRNLQDTVEMSDNYLYRTTEVTKALEKASHQLELAQWYAGRLTQPRTSRMKAEALEQQ